MSDLLAEGDAFLAETMATAVATQGTYRRGGQSASVDLTIGGPLEEPYGGSPFPTTGRAVYIPAADLVLGGVLTTPVEGDTVEWTEAGILQTLTVVAWGPDRLIFEHVDSGLTLKIYARPAARLTGRKTTTVGLERPTTPITRDEYGGITSGWTPVGADILAEVQPEQAGQREEGGRLVASVNFRVMVNSAAAIDHTWRLNVKSGPYSGKKIYVDSVTPVSGIANEKLILGHARF